MDTPSESYKGTKVSTELIASKCIIAWQEFDRLDLSELRLELSAGIFAIGKKIHVGLFPAEDKFSIVEPLYFCIRSYRNEGKHIYLEQTLSKSCVTSVPNKGNFLYDVDPKYLAAIRKIISNSDYIKQFISEILFEANRVYHLHCFEISLV